MTSCCGPGAYEGVFGPRLARHLAARYRRSGPDRTTRRLLGFLDARGIEGASVLEIGGGVGEVQLELLRRGAARTTNLELVDSYEAEAAALAAAAGTVGRTARRRIDIAADPGGVEPHDVVVLHRVVCCYPDHERLLTAAADHADRLLVLSFPPRTPGIRASLALLNVFYRATGRSFRNYAHSPEAMLAVLRGRGLRPVYAHRGRFWQVVGLVR
ncbi:SAM-dependent methyltransferase [uncultured Kocuria sp.]|uniref:SAM-dependent methyltransferase n=1 Tax=uncultured Kocuria sp. TaxID=259305 RepID=UPI00260E0206|nr:SAM-dependent methyltransferase [uncultured Kocuria sp.]